MLLRASPVEYLPLIEDHVFKTSHLNASPAAQIALNTRIVFIQTDWSDVYEWKLQQGPLSMIPLSDVGFRLQQTPFSAVKM